MLDRHNRSGERMVERCFIATLCEAFKQCVCDPFWRMVSIRTDTDFRTLVCALIFVRQALTGKTVAIDN